MRIFALLTDAYGVNGGIAVYNRDFLEALAADPKIEKITCLPRLIDRPMTPVPDKIDFRVAAAKGMPAYLIQFAKAWREAKESDLIYCAHVSLAPLAWLYSVLFRKPVLGALYGIEAWQPTKRAITGRLLVSIGSFYAISAFTKDRFRAWSGVEDDRIALLPNAVHLERYGLGPKSPALAKRLGVTGRTVLMTFGRLVSQERAKGFDEVMDILPRVAEKIPNIIYVIAGDGDYRPALEAKAERLGIADRVVFSGFVDEGEKADFYRLADAYVMPSRGEGFGFVFLEAMACGVPVVASTADGSRDAVLDGKLGAMVDPDDPAALEAAILKALKTKPAIPAGLSHFTFDAFAKRARAVAHAAMRKAA